MLRTLRASQNMKEWDNCLSYAEKFQQDIDKRHRKDLNSIKQNCRNKKI
jgi:hypothetical protein